MSRLSSVAMLAVSAMALGACGTTTNLADGGQTDSGVPPDAGLDAGPDAKTAREPGGPRFTELGGRVELQVSLFDFGEVRVREAETTYMQAVNQLFYAAGDKLAPPQESA